MAPAFASPPSDTALVSTHAPRSLTPQPTPAPLTRSPSAHNPTPFVSFLVRSCKPVWREYVRHPFVDQLGKGTLPLAAFKHYIIQDYHYLRHCE